MKTTGRIRQKAHATYQKLRRVAHACRTGCADHADAGGPTKLDAADRPRKSGGIGEYQLGQRAKFSPESRKVPTGPASLVIRNATVFTGVRGAPTAEAVAIKGDRILAVGTNTEVARHINSNTKVIDGAGRTVTPGFIETHGHLTDIAERAIGRIDKIAELATIPPIDGWIRAVGPGPKSLAQFDELTRGYPAYIEGHTGSTSWVNTKAMQLARDYWSKQPTFYGAPNPTFGDNTRLPVPPGGRVNEDTGTLHYANNLFFDGRDRAGVLPDYEELGGVMPQMSYEVLKEPLQHTMDYFKANGITGFHNMMGTPQDLMTLGHLEKDGLLTTRVHATQGMSQAKLHTQVTPSFLALMAEVRKRFNSDRLWTGMIKFNDAGTTVEQLAAEVSRLNANGMQAAVHTSGRMIRAFELADEASPGSTRQLRHRLEHTVGDSLELADRLGSGGTIQFSAPDRGIISKPSLRERWAGGTDWDVIEDIDPMRMIAVAARSFGSVEEALHGYTSNAAFLGHAEHMVGSLQPGMKADVVMLSNDILRNPSTIPQTKTLMTVFDGKIIYEAKGNASEAEYNTWASRVRSSGLEAASAIGKGKK